MNGLGWISIIISTIAVTISGLTAFFVFRQLNLAKSAIKIEAFDRRSQVYDAIREYISTVLAMGTTDQNSIKNLLVNTRHAEFLFKDKKLFELIETLFHKGLDLELNEKLLDSLDGPSSVDERKKLAEKHHVLLKWFSDQLEVVKDLFRKHLDIEVK